DAVPVAGFWGVVGGGEDDGFVGGAGGIEDGRIAAPADVHEAACAKLVFDAGFKGECDRVVFAAVVVYAFCRLAVGDAAVVEDGDCAVGLGNHGNIQPVFGVI